MSIPPRRRRPKQPAERAAPPALQVIAHIPGPFQIDSPELHAQLRGELELRTTDGKLGIFGHAETTTGRFELLGREYEIDRARASFDGDVDPVVDIRVTRVMADTTLVISVHGTARDPKLELSSDPPVYNSSQVLGLIVSGDPDDTRVDTATLDRQVVGALSGVLAAKLQGQLLSGLPLDVIRIEPTSGIEVGKYIRHNIYVSYVHHFGATMSDVHRTNAHEASFELRLRRGLMLGVRYGDAGIGAIDFAWTFRY